MSNAASSNLSDPDAISSKVAHELKNLLARIVANLELLHRQSLDERGQRQLERAEQAAWAAEEVIRKCPRLPAAAADDTVTH